jgi:hypothetical protein
MILKAKDIRRGGGRVRNIRFTSGRSMAVAFLVVSLLGLPMMSFG